MGRRQGSGGRTRCRGSSNAAASSSLSGRRQPASAETLPLDIGTRISVVGTCGAGKTTMARALAEKLRLVHIELDALAWGPRWTQRPESELRAAVASAASGEGWVIDGNYGKLRDIVWPRADTLVWLDYSFARVFWQLLRRTVRRAVTREELWHGNCESLRMSFLSRGSILLWAIQTHRRRKLQYGRLFASPGNQGRCLVHLRSPRQAQEWLANLSNRAA